MKIDKKFIDESNELIKQRNKVEKYFEKLKNDVQRKFELCMPRYNEMREKYRKALEELKEEFNLEYGFYGFPQDGYRHIRYIVYNSNCYNHYEVVADDYSRDPTSKKETFKIPYDEKDDSVFVAEYKEKEKQLYLKEQQKKLDESHNEYLKLKKEFEKHPGKSVPLLKPQYLTTDWDLRTAEKKNREQDTKGSPSMMVGCYREDGWIAEVEVLEDNSDEDWGRFKLKVLKTLQPSGHCKPMPNGTIFIVEQAKSIYGKGKIWTLGHY